MRLVQSDHTDFAEGGSDPDEGKTDLRLREAHDNDEIDSKYGFDRLTTGEKTAYLINMHACEVPAFSCIF